jgi:hypothetical protein
LHPHGHPAIVALRQRLQHDLQVADQRFDVMRDFFGLPAVSVEIGIG